MKKIYSFLLLMLFAMWGFVANADITIKITDPSTVYEVYTMYAGGPTATKVADGHYTCSAGNFAVIFTEDISNVSVTSETNPSLSIETDPTGYDGYSGIMVYGYSLDNQTIVVNNGEASSGGGATEAVPSDVVRIRFTNPSDVDKFYTGYWNNTYGGEKVVKDGYVDVPLGNVAFSLKSGDGVINIQNVTQGKTWTSSDTNNYEYSGGYYTVYGYNCFDLGDLVIVNNGEDTSGGDEYVPEGDYLAHIKVADPAAIAIEAANSNYNFYIKKEVVSDGLLLTIDDDAKGWGPYFDFYVYANSGYKITSLTNNGESVEDYDGWYEITPGSYDSKYEIVVGLADNAVPDYSVVCEADVLQFGELENIKKFNATYDESTKTYVIDNPSGSLFVSLKPEALTQYTLSEISYSGADAWSGGYYIMTLSDIKGTPLEVKLAPMTTVNVAFNDASKVTVIESGNAKYAPSNYSSGWGNGKTMWDYLLANSSDGTIAYDQAVGTLKFTVANKYFVKSITSDGVAVPTTETLPSQTVTANLSGLSAGSTIDVTIVSESELAEPDPIVWTFNCAEDVLTFAQSGNEALKAEYANGAYAVSELKFDASLAVNTAEGYEFESFVVAEGSEVTPTVRFEGSMASVNTYGFEGAASFNVTVAESAKEPLVYTFLCDADALSFSYRGSEIEAAYDEGSKSYTIVADDYENSFDVEIKSDLQSEYNIESATCNGTAISVFPVDAPVGFAFPMYTFNESSTITVTLKKLTTEEPNPTTTFTWSFTGEAGLSIKYNGNEFTYADGVYTYTGDIDGWENYYQIEVSSASDELELVSVVIGEETFEPVGASGVIYIPTSALSATNLSFTVNTKAATAGESKVYTFIFSNKNHIGSVSTVNGMEADFVWDENTMTYGGTQDIVIYPQNGCTIKSINIDSEDGTALATTEFRGGTQVSISTLEFGKTYYVSTEGPSAEIPTNAYVFNCEADVLDFSWGYNTVAGFSAVYSDGKYVVSPIPSGSNYQYYYLTISVKDEYKSDYTISAITAGTGTKLDGSYGWQIAVAYYPAPIEWTVEFANQGGGEDDTPYTGFDFKGENFSISYAYQNFEISNGHARVPAETLRNSYGELTINPAEGYEIVSVVDEAGTELSVSDGTVVFSVVNYAAKGFVQKFEVTTQEASKGEPLTFTAELKTGNWYEATMYVGNGSGIEFDVNPRTISTDNSQTIYIKTTSGNAPYRVTVDGTEIPTDLWDYNPVMYGDCYTIEPGSEYYPQNNGKIEIFITEPVTNSHKVTFEFVNPDTDDFIEAFSINSGFGFNVRTLRGEDEYNDAMENGLTLPAGQGLEIYFKSGDYAVNSATLNGSDIDVSDGKYTVESIDGDLKFKFDVSLTDSRKVNFNVTGEYNQLYVVDRNFAGESNIDQYYTLSAAECVLELGQSVTEIKVIAKDGYEIPENGISYVTAGEEVVINAGEYFTVVDGMTVNVTVNSKATPSERVFTVYSEADVLYFNYPDPNNDYAITQVTAPWTAPAQEGEKGHYTITNFTGESLYLNVKEDARNRYVLSYVEYVEQNNYQIPSGNGVTVSLPVTQISGNASFNVVFAADIAPVNIQIDVNNPSCISRIYGGGVTMTASTVYPYTYDLNNGKSLTIELRDNCTLNGVTVEGEGTVSYSGMVIDLSNVVEGDIVKIDVSANTGDYVYKFSGPEGLTVTFNTVAAEFVDGEYIVQNVYRATKNNYNVSISVANGYENKIKLVSVSERGEEKWTPSGTEGIIYIPGSELPEADAEFVINTTEPQASETTRTVYLTIDDRSVVRTTHYQGGSSEPLAFDEDGVVKLTITPSQKEVRIQTSKSIVFISTDKENTFVMPELPKTEIVLDLTNALDGQTINLYVNNPYEIELGEPEVTYSDDNKSATIEFDYEISEELVGQTITVSINGEEYTFTPDGTSGTFSQSIDLSGMPAGENKVTIKVSAFGADEVETTVTVSTTSGVLSIFADENGEVVVYNMQGVRVKNTQKLDRGFYIINGRKVFVK